MKVDITTPEKIRLIAKRKGMTIGEIADGIQQSRQNLSNKMTRNNFREDELQAIAAALGCKLKIEFVLEDGTVI